MKISEEKKWPTKDLGFWVFEAIVISMTVVAVVLIFSKAGERMARDFADQSERMASVQIAAECSQAPSFEVCANEIKRKARADLRSEYDLSSQRTMSYWTAVMGGMAVIGIGLSAVGVFLIWRTWEATREASAAGIAANLLAARAQRPWITISLKRLEAFQTDTSIAITGEGEHLAGFRTIIEVELENLGVSPAANVQLHHQIYGINQAIPPSDHERHKMFLDANRFPEWGDLLAHRQKITMSVSASELFQNMDLAEMGGREAFTPIVVVTAIYRPVGSEDAYSTTVGFVLGRQEDRFLGALYTDELGLTTEDVGIRVYKLIQSAS